MALLMVVLFPAALLADPADTIGISWAGRATAGGCTAGCGGAAAAYYNPGLAGLGGPSAFLGATAVVSRFEPQSVPATSTVFVEGGLSLPLVELGRAGGLWLAAAAMTPATTLYDFQLRDDEAPAMLLLDSRERRLSLSAAMAYNLEDLLGIGVGFELLPTVTGKVGADLANPAGTNELFVDVGYRLSPTAGVMVDLDPLRVGLSYRGENGTDVTIPVAVAAEGLNLSAAVSAAACRVPHRLATGLEWSVNGWLLVEADLTWQLYSGLELPAPEVAVGGEEGVEMTSQTASAALTDLFSPALTVKLAVPVTAAVGYRFIPAVTGLQEGRANVLDSSRHLIAGGVRLPVLSGGMGPSNLFVTADLFALILQPRRHYKRELIPDNPGYPSLASSGFRLGGSLGIEVEY